MKERTSTYLYIDSNGRLVAAFKGQPSVYLDGVQEDSEELIFYGHI